MDSFVSRHGLVIHDATALRVQALHSVETFLRTRSPQDFAGMSWRAFLATVLVYLSKRVLSFSGPNEKQPPSLPTLPTSQAYLSQVMFLPFEKIGEFWFSGDWYGGSEAPDGALWLMVADVTGHGHCAHLLASNLPLVWQRCWQGFPAVTAAPVEFLRRIHDLLADCLPEGIFIEASIGRFRSNGHVIVAPAGGTRILQRRNSVQEAVVCHVLRGGWIGLSAPEEQDQATWDLNTGEELLLSSDGLYDQLLNRTRTRAGMIALLAESSKQRSLFDSVRDLVDESLKQESQCDDITVVAVQRKE